MFVAQPHSLAPLPSLTNLKTRIYAGHILQGRYADI